MKKKEEKFKLPILDELDFLKNLYTPEQIQRICTAWIPKSSGTKNFNTIVFTGTSDPEYIKEQSNLKKSIEQINENKMGQITVNGATYTGNSVVIINGKVIIDGKDFTPDDKQIKISVEGKIDTLNVDACDTVSVVGSVDNVSTGSGNVTITGHVLEGVTSMSGNVECGSVGGSVKTMSGNIRHR